MDHKDTLRFDVTRGAAAIVVLLTHIAQAFIWRFYGATSWMDMAGGWAARFAVLAFFLLSGRLIVGSIISNVKRTGHFDAVDYFLNRIARIYPPFLLAVVLAIAVVAVIQLFELPGSNGSPLGSLRATGLSFTFDEVLKSLALYGGLTTIDGPLWTLYIEVKLYIAAGGLALLIFGRGALTKAGGASLIAFAIWTGVDHYRFWFFVVIWCFGAITNLPAAKSTASFLGIALVAIFFCQVTRGYPSYIDGSMGTLVQSTGCAVIAYALLVRDWSEVRFPYWLVKTGDFSYTLYVIHFPVLALCLSISLKINGSSLALAGAAALLCAATALLLAMFGARLLEDAAANKKVLLRWLMASRSVATSNRSLP